MLGVPADVTSAEDVQGVVEDTIQTLGRLGILVNNAGGIVPDHSADTSDEEWRYAMDLNLNSAIRFTRPSFRTCAKPAAGALSTTHPSVLTL